MMNLKITNAQMKTYVEEQRMPTLKDLAILLDPENDNEIQSVDKKSQKVSTLTWVNDEDYDSIFTILKDYPEYEFQIDRNLKLATINGVKVADTSEDANSKKIESLINTSDDIYNNGYIFNLATNYPTFTSNNTINLNKSIENYDYIIFEFDVYYTTYKAYSIISTQTFSVDQIKSQIYGEQYNSNFSYMLVATAGDANVRLKIWFEDNKTIKVLQSWCSNEQLTKFRITNIKGVKY